MPLAYVDANLDRAAQKYARGRSEDPVHLPSKLQTTKISEIY
jgi:hypothetical protein